VEQSTGLPQHASDTAASGIDPYVAGTLKPVDEAALQDGRASRMTPDHQICVGGGQIARSTGGGYAHAAGRSAIWMSDGR